jgi:hypothetical protein
MQVKVQVVTITDDGQFHKHVSSCMSSGALQTPCAPAAVQGHLHHPDTAASSKVRPSRQHGV